MSNDRNSIKVGGDVSNTQISQGSDACNQDMLNNSMNLEEVQLFLNQLKTEISAFNFDSEKKTDFLNEVYSIENEIASKEDTSKIKSRLFKLKDMLANFATGLASSGAITVIGHFLGA